MPFNQPFCARYPIVRWLRSHQELER